mmetsp:Transcript_27783/g.39054  ORF Transcript_27783/g.39054 Transcript_27783/m.39054 type:complete len:223 (-) Transcript_27783:126-794(-)
MRTSSQRTVLFGVWLSLNYLCHKNVQALLQLNHPQIRRSDPKTSYTRTSIIRHVEPVILVGAAGVVGTAAAAWWKSGSEERERQQKYAEIESRNEALREERAKLAYIEPRDGGEGLWSEAELAQYDGTDETGPLLFAADGYIFNVWKGRHFYGPGCEYHIFAGRDATRLLAKSKLEEETPEELKKPLNIAERAALAGWIYTFKTKYDIVGRLEGYDPKSTAM